MNDSNTDRLDAMTDKATQTAEQAIKVTQQAAGDALATLSATMESLRKQAAPWLTRSSEDLGDFAQRGIDRANHAAHRAHTRALQVTGDAEHLIVKDPLKAVLVAAASGAALMALMMLVTRSNRGS